MFSSIPRSYLCATAMITRVEVLDLEALTELMAPQGRGMWRSSLRGTEVEPGR